MSIDTELLPGKERAGGRIQNFLFAVLACVIACTAYYQFMVNSALVEVEMNVDKDTTFSVYWAAEGDGYSERRRAQVKAHPGLKAYSFYLTDISDVARLRIDTHTYVGEATLKRLAIKQEGYAPVVFSDAEQFRTLTPVQQIEDYTVDERGLHIKSTGTDPHFELVLSLQYLGLFNSWLLLRFGCVAFFVFVVVYACAPLGRKFLFVPICLFGVWLLVFSMAGVSKENAHPDEYVHILATNYYADHWLPPQVEDPDIRDTYSVYGASRLNSGEIYYLCAGKIYKLSQVFHFPQTLGYRLLNLGLFGLIFFLSIRNVYARIAALPYLLSPQIWYVFSYCDSDAFALFISYLLVCQVINPSSTLHRYLKGESGWLRFIALIGIPLIIGTAFLLKKNYYPFVGIFYLYMGVQIFFTEEYYWDKKGAIIRLLLITLLALGFMGVRIGADYAVNGMDRKEKIAALQEELSAYSYKRSTPPEERMSTLYMRDKGVLLKDMISKYYWDKKIFHSAFGVYGYLTISGPQQYYKVVQSFGVLLLAFVLVSCIARGGLMGAGSSLVVCGTSVLLIYVALHHCWTHDFQAQGRYLLPVVPIFGILIGQNIKVIEGRVLFVLIGGMYILGLYSFIFHGLSKIPKIHF